MGSSRSLEPPVIPNRAKRYVKSAISVCHRKPPTCLLLVAAMSLSRSLAVQPFARTTNVARDQRATAMVTARAMPVCCITAKVPSATPATLRRSDNPCKSMFIAVESPSWFLHSSRSHIQDPCNCHALAPIDPFRWCVLSWSSGTRCQVHES